MEDLMQQIQNKGLKGPLIQKTSTAMTPDEYELQKSYNKFMKQRQSPFMGKDALAIEGNKFLGAAERAREQRQKAGDYAFRKAYEGKPY